MLSKTIRRLPLGARLILRGLSRLRYSNVSRKRNGTKRVDHDDNSLAVARARRLYCFPCPLNFLCWIYSCPSTPINASESIKSTITSYRATVHSPHFGISVHD